LSGERWGILGGTFDPPHYGHLIIAEQTREALDLAGVLFMPAAQPPHKLEWDITPAGQRRDMVELAIADNPAFSLLTIELERAGPSYSVDSLERLSADGQARSSSSSCRLRPRGRCPRGVTRSDCST